MYRISELGLFLGMFVFLGMSFKGGYLSGGSKRGCRRCKGVFLVGRFVLWSLIGRRL